MATQRPVVTVYSSENKNAVASAPLPDVFNAPIRADIVNIFHNFALKNLRQPYAVHRYAGKQHSAESWGTGRAVSRIPRISGGGTHRSGQGAFGNMCRGGRMFAPTKIFRRWASKVNHNEKRYAVVSAIAASGVAPLVMSRGHKIEQLAEVPFVVSNEIESYTKTKQAAQFLTRINAVDDVQKVKDSKTVRAGKGKTRGRRYKQRKGPLVVYKNDNGIVRAFRNIPGVDLLSVDRLNVLKLAPGGRVGRFIIWTQGAFDALNARFGSYNNRFGASVHKRQNATYHLPRPSVSNTDISGIIASDAIQNVVRPAQIKPKAGALKSRRQNPLRRFGFYQTLNPLATREAKKAFWTKLQSSSKTAKVEKTDKLRQERKQKAMTNFYDKFIKPLSQ